MPEAMPEAGCLRSRHYALAVSYVVSMRDNSLVSADDAPCEHDPRTFEILSWAVRRSSTVGREFAVVSHCPSCDHVSAYVRAYPRFWGVSAQARALHEVRDKALWLADRAWVLREHFEPPPPYPSPPDPSRSATRHSARSSAARRREIPASVSFWLEVIMFWRRKPEPAESEPAKHPIEAFCDWIDAGAPGTDREEPAMTVAGWRVPISLVEEWEAQAEETPHDGRDAGM